MRYKIVFKYYENGMEHTDYTNHIELYVSTLNAIIISITEV